jgi:N-acetylneuraminic acid mutarotase
MNKIVPVMLVLFFIMGLFTTVFSSVSALELIEDSWKTKTPSSQTTWGSIVSVEDKIYVIGGSYTTEDPGNGQYPYPLFVTHYCDTNKRYDTVTDTWTTLKPMPTPRADLAIAAYDGKIYCIGGQTGEKKYVS